MEVDRSKIPSNRVYESHSGGVLLTGLLGLVVAGLMVAFFFLPIVAYFPAGEERVDMTGLNLLCYSLRSFMHGGYNTSFDRFAQNVGSYNGQVAILSFVSQYQSTVEMVLIGFFVISALFAAIVALYSLAFLLRGHMKTTLMVSALSHSVVSFLSLFTGLLFLHFFLCRKMFIEVNIMDHIRFYMTPFIIIIAQLFVAILLSAIYKKCFRRRVYINNYKPRVDNNPEYLNSPVQRYIANFPNGTKQIGERAFEGNADIRNAYIPEGIVSLAPRAFANCPNLEKVTLPVSLKEIGSECFAANQILKAVNYKGTTAQWEAVSQGANWHIGSGIEVVEASDGKVVIE